MATTLATFIQGEMSKRGMSIREFATLVQVSHVTIVRALSADPPMPSLEFLDKLARATSTDVCTLVALVLPNSSRINANAALLAQRIEELPEDIRESVDNLIVGAVMRRFNIKP